MPSLVNTGVSVAVANIAASTTDSALVTAVAGKRIRVLGFHISCGGTASTVVFNSKPGGAGTAISPVYNNSLVASAEGGPYFDSATGEGLTATTGAGSTTGVLVKWAPVTP